MKSKFILIPILFIISLLTFCGGNPALFYPIYLKDRPNIKFPYTIYSKNNITLKIEPCYKHDLEAFADIMGYYTAQKFSRLPDLTYFCFSIENQSNEDFTINLFDSYFLDTKEIKYPPIFSKEYKKIYSSAAYFRFEYDNMFSSFIYDIDKKNILNPSKRRQLPNSKTTIKPKEFLRQIIPFQDFSLSQVYFQFQLKISDTETIKEDFFTKTFRDD